MTIRDSISTIAGTITGTALVLGALGIGVLFVPMAVISVSRWFDYEWWSALIIIILVQLLPGLGQLATTVAAIMGAWYLYHADFDWEEAINPQLAGFERNIESSRPLLIDQITNECLNSPQSLEDAGVGKDDYRTFCQCVAEKSAVGFNLNEMRYQMLHKEPSPQLLTIMFNAYQDCRYAYVN